MALLRADIERNDRPSKDSRTFDMVPIPGGTFEGGVYAKRIKLYPLSQAANPPAATFVDAIGQFEVLFRFYGPEKLFDKTWKLPDIEWVATQ